ncbi:MAG: hypothetical protein VXZ82_24255 [Planctomycetota bacterium]|nr:hypothetical protein [Planctomycetota bacterium]
MSRLVCNLAFISIVLGTVMPIAQAQEARSYAPLPFEITSFGAARVSDHIFTYGGHTGAAHSYSTEEQSNQLQALDLTDPEAKWEKIAEGKRLQGLAMVPHGNKLIILGGFSALNKSGDEHDLHSQTSVTAYSLAQKKWRDLPALPEGRSSHDAAILEGTIYAVGGWTMAGEKDTVWHTTALKLNLNDIEAGWQEIAKPPFQRRALAVVAHAGKIYVLGGMDKKGGPTKEVQVYDPKSDSWSKGPQLAGDGRMAGFGAAGWSVGGKLIANTYEGKLLQLADDGKTWEDLGTTEESRFFHRLVPLTNSSLISLGGANMEIGKFLNLEVIKLEQ